MPAPPTSSTGPRLGAVQVTSSPEGDRPDLAESSSSLSVPKAQVSAEKGSGPTTRRSGGTRARSGGAGSREALHAVGPLRGPVLQELPVSSCTELRYHIKLSLDLLGTFTFGWPLGTWISGGFPPP